ncbi:protein of unknown function DUF1680 [Coriobacterium glomerans PW2]|uniref:Glycoside hydrolase family 127 protein n=1 Tax=Coriobacterium glomerans (strain ATCC 49209 / DSM 20642 / JCM 10262 / PW2) TaxID=700015 RepID=F2NAY2_CORGP|nr:beta-L-arabinofuranosidase domain-containing protein [Coriobacterium glomerans]AEB07660.1 protein of unknown function DUF1680 [Coriobacterium glomerans PW2]
MSDSKATSTTQNKTSAHVTIKDAFWSKRIDLVLTQMLPFQWRVLNDAEPDVPKSGAIQNFKIAAGEATGEFYGMVFQDTDLHKWLEAAAYALELTQDPELKAHADEAWRLIAKAQMDDGYVDTYFQIKAPEYRWTSLQDNHELYTAGHLIEAGVAYHQATGSQIAFDVITKLADLLVKRFLTDGTAGVPGHPEIELALMRLYHLTGKDAYYRLARHFVLSRGQKPSYFEAETADRREKKIPNWLDIAYNHGEVDMEEPVDLAYYVASKPLIDQNIAEGHAVRAGYLYAGLADVAAASQDDAIKAAALRLWHNLADTQMYVTGGIGSTNMCEGFTHEYDLPNESNYCETCAGISLILFARRLQMFSSDSQFADVIERDLYNNTLGSMSMDATRFYYRNELERWGAKIARAGRPGWHACACCPPNLARLILSLNRYLYHEVGATHYVDQFIGSTYRSDGVAWSMSSTMPESGCVKLMVEAWAAGHELAVRIPAWSQRFRLELNGRPLHAGIDFVLSQGYALVLEELKSGDELELKLDMAVKTVHVNSRVKYDAGKVALMRGPLVYCAEEADNHIDDFWNVVVPADAVWSENAHPTFPDVRCLTGTVRYAASTTPALYSYDEPEIRSIPLTLVPFYTRYNRSLGAMQVYFRQDSRLR